MMNRTFQSWIFCLLLTTPCLTAEASRDANNNDPITSITVQELKSTIYFLAADEFEGRDALSPANRIAGLYLAHQFEMLGLEPAGNDGTFFQKFKLVQASLGERNRMSLDLPSSLDPEESLLHEEFYPAVLSSTASASAPLVFGGYGITATELGYDDYQQISAEGKILIIFAGEPAENDPNSPFDGIVSSGYSELHSKIATAQEHGAVGLIVLRKKVDGALKTAAARTWPEDPRRARLNPLSWIEDSRIPVVYASTELMERTLKGVVNLEVSIREIDDTLRPHSYDLPDFSATIETEIEHTEVELSNVLGVLRGTDPELREEIVVIGAHFDHVRSSNQNDLIYNGADDDASGTAGVLEVAEAMILNPVPPRRTVLFALWNAEEKGLLGARSYVAAPRYPLENTVAMIQLDMIGRNQEIPDGSQFRFAGLSTQSAEENRNTVHVLGYSRSEDIAHLVRSQNMSIGLDLLFELDNQRLELLRRTDSWPFLIEGIPSLFFTTGLHPDYHTPGDTADKINYPKLEKIVRLTYLCATDLANANSRPKLNPRR